MKLEEKHKEFVVKCFARFMKLTDIVNAFIEKFEDELPSPDLPKIPTPDEILAEDLSEEDLDEKLKFIDRYLEKHREAFQKEYGDEADKMLKKRASEEFDTGFVDDYTYYYESQHIQARREFPKQLRENLFNRFRRLNIEHPQFPNKYRALFNETRDAFCANYRIPDLNNPENLERELETIYGYHKQLIFRSESSKEVLKHLTSAHQILKTIVAYNTINAQEEIVEVTSQKATRQEPQQALTEDNSDSGKARK